MSRAYKSKAFFFILIFFSLNSSASKYNYLFPYQKPTYTNYGSIGIIQNPTSRFNKEGTLAFSWSHNEPYLRGSILAYPFSWLEASFQYTDSNNALYSPVYEFMQSITQDKSFDFKIKCLMKQVFPQTAIGFRDIAGTGRFGSEYITLSKFLTRNLDLTLGIGWGNLSGNYIKNPLNQYRIDLIVEVQNLI